REEEHPGRDDHEPPQSAGSYGLYSIPARSTPHARVIRSARGDRRRRRHRQPPRDKRAAIPPGRHQTKLHSANHIAVRQTLAPDPRQRDDAAGPPTLGRQSQVTTCEGPPSWVTSEKEGRRPRRSRPVAAREREGKRETATNVLALDLGSRRRPSRGAR